MSTTLDQQDLIRLRDQDVETAWKTVTVMESDDDGSDADDDGSDSDDDSSDDDGSDSDDDGSDSDDDGSDA